MIVFFLAISIFLESTLTTLPISLLIIIFAAVTLRKNDIFILAFLSGLFLDILRLGTVGLTSAYFVTVVAIIFAYQRKLEITSLTFITLVVAVGSFGYLFLLGVSHIVAQALISTLFVVISFLVFKKMNTINIFKSWKK